MNSMIEAILHNLTNAGWAMLIFLCAYVSNMAFSLYYNIKTLGESFTVSKLINSAYKVGSIGIGLTLLVVATTSLPAFANYIGWTIPDEYAQVFDDLAVLGVCLYVSCKYIAEAVSKFTAILNEKKLLAKKENNNDTAGSK